MSKKIFSLLLASLMLLSLVAGISGCKETPADYSGEDSGITFSIDRKDFTANTLNLPLTNQDIALFDRFYKTDKSRGLDKNGVGLGLYISKTIIDAHGESIAVESGDGSGCEFWFTLKEGTTIPKRKNITYED